MVRPNTTQGVLKDPDGLPTVLIWIGLLAWACVSTASVVRALTIERLAYWSLASALFVATFCLAQRSLRVRNVLLAAQSAAVVAMAAILCNGYEGFLLTLVAAQLGWRVAARTGLAWIAVQTLILAGAIALEWNVRSALLLAPPYLGLQILMFVVMRLYAQERALRLNVESAHAEVLALEQQLAERARLDERLRMTQDLHDTFGHHLTALSLNLEAATHESGPRAQASLRTAQDLAGVLLDDIKGLVRSLKSDGPVDLIGELGNLARDLPRPRIHLDMPAAVVVQDPSAGRALLQCAQEIVTNAIRHGTADNLWIEVAVDRKTLRLTARDDGDVVRDIHDGFGLTGMRRRLTKLGGSLVTEPLAAGGLEVRAELPLETQDA